MNNVNTKFAPLKAKHTIPYLPSGIHRERFNPVFDEMRDKKIITIVAGAGYGKTTLAVQACQYLCLNSVWYRLDETDCDFFTFVHYLIQGIRHYYHNFGNDIFNWININEIKKEDLHSVLTMLLNEIGNTIDKDLLIVLDDFHTVNNNKEILEALAFLIRHMFKKLHLVIISRTIPDLEFSQYAARRQIIEITEKDIAFNKSEVESLYREIFKIQLNKNNARVLYDKTKGWIAGLILFHYSIRENTDMDLNKYINQLNGSKRAIFDYLEENVFYQLPDKTVEFLVRTSILSRLDVDFCDRFLKIKNSGNILKELSRKRLFTNPVDEKEKSYYYHHLFREFLTEKLDKMFDGKSIAGFHKTAASIREKNNEPEEAIYHYLKAELYEKACKLLIKTGWGLILSGRINLFLSYYKDIPDVITHNEPWIRYQYAMALALSGKTIEAIKAYDHARKIFRENKMLKEEGQCLNEIVYAYLYILGDLQKAEDKVNELIHRFKNIPILHVHALSHLIFLSTCSGKYDEADLYYSELLTSVKSLISNQLRGLININYGFRFVYSGDMIKARDYGEMGLGLSERLKFDNQFLFACHLVSMVYYYMGDFSKGYEIALKGIRLCEEKGLPESASAWDLIAACFCGAETDKIADAIAFGLKALKISEEFEGLRIKAWAYHAMGNAYLKSGDLLKAEESERSAIYAIQRVNKNFLYEEACMNTGLANILLEKGQTENAFQLLGEAEKHVLNHKWDLARVLVLLSRCCWLKKQENTAKKNLRSALILSKENGYDRWIIKEAEWIIPLLLDLYPENELHAYIKTLFQRFDINIPGILKRIQKHINQKTKKNIALILNEVKKIPPPGLRIYCFGKFRLFMDKKEILPEEWKNEKAKLLLKYLVFNHNRGYVAKDFLLELLWPCKDPAVTNNRFHVSLTAIRKILEPELPRGMQSSYLLRKGDAYKFDLGYNGYIDVTSFDEELAHIEKKKDTIDKLEYYLKAEKIYKGNLFEEDRYASWCDDARDEYKEKYLKVLRYLISYYDKKDQLECQKYIKKYLMYDEYAEDIYQLQMKLYNMAGNRSMVIRTFELCKKKLETELESPISEETEKVYKQIIMS